MKRFMKALDEYLSEEEIIYVARKLNQLYYAYMLDSQVWELLYFIFPIEIHKEILRIQEKHVGHNVVNEILMNYYPSERQIKYYLTKRFLNNIGEVTLYEMRVANSRLDYGRINGSSYAYEIKTELDTLNKLEKQIEDYSKVFEFVSVVIHSKHLKKAKEILPSYCGIEVYDKCMDSEFFIERKAEKSPFVNIEAQIAALTSKDLDFIINNKQQRKICNNRKAKEEYVFNSFLKEDINYLFKEAIKNRYNERWNYLKKQFKKINPIDVQELYIGPIDPSLIYIKNSCIV